MEYTDLLWMWALLSLFTTIPLITDGTDQLEKLDTTVFSECMLSLFCIPGLLIILAAVSCMWLLGALIQLLQRQ